jgi:hypothetical protein
MNTPKPCDTCGWLYADCMQKDNPTYQAECMCRKEDCTYGKKGCPNWVHWEKFSWTKGEIH